ncbi:MULTISPECIES: copper chaperone PCu(A)C [unclassified Microbulbifer]|uniref:copper chaperone PCu(A)C n=1 Tax=unclassified Microbulbifer TaxID=2619833 RepID=UPI0027E3D757|nr:MULTISPECIES: copper chaperone PCu(A)C [unclassified Microbulbifer]
MRALLPVCTFAITLAMTHWVSGAERKDTHSTAELTVADAWQPDVPSLVRAGYFTLTNTSSEEMTLIEVMSSVFESVEIHRSVVVEGIAGMEALERLSIAPGETVKFEPESLHLMMQKPKRTLGEGDHIDVALVFSNGATKSFTMPVKARLAGYGSASHEAHHE